MTNLHTINTSRLDGPVSVPEQLRKLADEIERGDWNDVRTVLLVLDRTMPSGSDGVSLKCLGYRPRISASVGLLHTAAHDLLEDRDNG